jgi:hypothetical protein
MEQAAGEAVAEGSRAEAQTVEVMVEAEVAPSLAALEPLFLLVAAALAACWAESGFSPPWGATGQVAGKAC